MLRCRISPSDASGCRCNHFRDPRLCLGLVRDGGVGRGDKRGRAGSGAYRRPILRSSSCQATSFFGQSSGKATTSVNAESMRPRW